MSDAKALGLHKIKQLQGWLAQCAEHPPSDQPLVVFAIPLIRPEATPDWDGVCQNLARTIASLRAQTNPNWRAYVCGHVAPANVTFDDQVVFLTYEEARSANLSKSYEANGQSFVYDKTTKTR